MSFCGNFGAGSVAKWPPGPYSGLFEEAPLEKEAIFELAVYQILGEIVILVY